MSEESLFGQKKERTIGLEYKGNPLTSFRAFLATSADSNETKAWPRMRRLLCATTSTTSPYDLKRPRKDALRTERDRQRGVL